MRILTVNLFFTRSICVAWFQATSKKDDKVYTKLRSIARTIQKFKTVDNLPPAWWYVRFTWSSPQSSLRLKMLLFDSLMPKHDILSNGNVAVLHTRRSLAESSEIWWRSSCGPSRQRGDDNSRETNHQFEMRGGRRTGIWLQAKTTMAGPNAEILKSKVSSFSAFGSFRDSFWGADVVHGRLAKKSK